MGLTFVAENFVPAIVLGIAAASLYGILAVPIVLTYRVSRTIGFVQGGIAFFSTYFYLWLAQPDQPLDAPRMGNNVAAMLVVVFTGGLLAAIYGATVTGKRMANLPRITLTVYSLGALLILAGVAVTVSKAASLRAPSPFGDNVYRIFDTILTMHQIVTFIIIVVLVTGLTLVLKKTRTGIYVRAIADSVETSRTLGIPLNRVGTGVYVATGIVAGLAGVLLANTVGSAAPNIVFVFLRALLVSVLGGFTSLPLALGGCLMLGIVETMLISGVFGVIAPAHTEIIVVGLIFGLVFLLNFLRPMRVVEATGL